MPRGRGVTPREFRREVVRRFDGRASESWIGRNLPAYFYWTRLAALVRAKDAAGFNSSYIKDIMPTARLETK